METVLIVILVIAAVLVVVGAIVGLIINTDRNRRRVREDFGPEYHRELARSGGDRGKAQKELEERQKRVSRLDIRELPGQLAQRFKDEWRRIQERFVDAPNESTRDADRLVQEVMEARGYPTADFDERAADISVDHPEVVENYRRAHQISQNNERGEASTEDLRQAFVYYRALFVELLPAEEERARAAAPGASRRS
jgi:hypothetical protein